MSITARKLILYQLKSIFDDTWRTFNVFDSSAEQLEQAVLAIPLYEGFMYVVRRSYACTCTSLIRMYNGVRTGIFNGFMLRQGDDDQLWGSP